MRISLTAKTFGEAEIEEVIESLRSGNVTMGAKCRAFEQAFAARLKARHAIFVNSGSSANLLAWFALANPLMKCSRAPLKPGFEVIVPAVAWSTTIWPIVQAGGVPVLVDCDPATLAIRPDLVAAAVTPATVAVSPVHPLGNVCDMDTLADICGRRDLYLIEDTCEALGSLYKGREAGRFGLMGTYSFYYSHHITTVEGGMIVTDDDDLAALLRVLRSHGWAREVTPATGPVPFAERYRFINTGFNLRPSELNAAFGLHQLARLDDLNANRRSATQALCLRLEPHVKAGRLRLMTVTAGGDAAFFGFPALCRNGDERDRLVRHLEARGVETRPIICGNMARQPAMQHVRHRVAGPLLGADEIMFKGLYWGMHPSFGEAEIDYIADVIEEFSWS